MEVFCLMYEGLNPNDSGLLAIYANRYAADEAMAYANSLSKYFSFGLKLVLFLISSLYLILIDYL